MTRSIKDTKVIATLRQMEVIKLRYLSVFVHSSHVLHVYPGVVKCPEVSCLAYDTGGSRQFICTPFILNVMHASPASLRLKSELSDYGGFHVTFHVNGSHFWICLLLKERARRIKRVRFYSALADRCITSRDLWPEAFFFSFLPWTFIKPPIWATRFLPTLTCQIHFFLIKVD